MRKYIMLLLLVVITIGCSNEDARQSEEVEEESKEEQVNKDEENTDQSDEVSSTLSEISISSELEVIKQLSPGQLTKELSYEEETEGVLWGIDDLDQGFLEELKDAIQSDLTVTDHPETFLKTLIYYAGSPYHSQLLSELEDYHPNYQEPLLPRPETVEDEENEASDYAYIFVNQHIISDSHFHFNSVLNLK